VTNATAECETTCAANDTIGCTTPANCAGAVDGGTECCAVANLAANPDGAAFPHCEIAALTSYCGGGCKTAINVLAGCTATGDILHVCSATSDCTAEGNGAQCCTVYGYNVCLQSGLITLGGSSISCMP
jgi:hypothetical protein